MPQIINFVLFQAGWFSCVMFGRGDYHIVGTLTVAVIAAFHLLRSDRPGKEFIFLLIATLIGFIQESAMTGFGLLDYSHGKFHPAFAPHWIIAMWTLFATTINVSLKWLQPKVWLQVLFGAAGGPLAFYAGWKLDAVSIPDMTTAMIVLAVCWGILTPVLFLIAKKFNGFNPPSR